MSIRAQLLEYCQTVEAGEIVACMKHKWACLRFVSDCRRSDEKDPSFPYYFDDAAADSFFRWMGLFSHRKGILKGQKITPAPIQLFVFGNIYGWRHRITGYRRFNKFYWQVARKNAKSQSLAMVGTYETLWFLGEETAEVYCAATKTEQAKIVYDEAVAMLNGARKPDGSKLFDLDRVKIAYNRITRVKNGSTMRTLSEEDRKTGDGLNPQCGIIDEYHAHEDSLIYDVIDSGMGARAQPLLGIITTAGFELQNPCYRIEYDLVSKILNPDIPINLENYFCMVNELDKDKDGNISDNIKDPVTWEKANPIACSYPEGREYIKKRLEESLEAPEKMKNFLTKHLNVWINQRESGFILMDRWTACREPEPVDLRGRQCFIGLDLSAKLDLTSVGFEFLIDGVYHVRSHSFIPEDTMREKIKTDKMPYDLWVDQGWVTATPGPVVDYKAVYYYILDQILFYNLKVVEICLDPWGAVQISSDFIEKGYMVVEIIQGPRTLSEPTKNFREMVYLKKVRHDDNPVLTWAVSNAVAEAVDRNQNILLSKKRSKQRIDPVAALLNAHCRAMVKPSSSGGRVFFV